VKEQHLVVVVANPDEDQAAATDFVEAVKRGLAKQKKCKLVEQDRSKDYFSVYLRFNAIDDEATAVSVVSGFHDGRLDADYFLEHWSSHFLNRESQENARLLVYALDKEIVRRIAQGWLEKDWLKKRSKGMLLSPNEQIVRTLAKRLAAAFWSFHRDETFDEALAATEADFDEKNDEPWIALADRLVWYLLKGIGEKQPSVREHVQ
jgi:hypothetical protein